MNLNQLYQLLYSGSVESRLDRAARLYVHFRHILLSSEEMKNHLADLTQAHARLSAQMDAMAMGKICTACATGQGGGCCSLYMAGETDTVQLLLNMLAGVRVAMVRADGRECCYLGETGCIFAYKPMFCVNYNCLRIGLGMPDQQAELSRYSGLLLGCQYRAEQYLLDVFQQLPDDRLLQILGL